MTKLSKKKGGGLIYNPPMMQFDGSTGYYSFGSATTSGNAFKVVAEFKSGSFTTSGRRISSCVKTHGRYYLTIRPSDYATASERGRLVATSYNDAGTIICQLISSMAINDDVPHTVFYAFDATAGTASFVIDGVNADDTGQANRVAPTTGTLPVGATSTFGVGADSGGTSKLNGRVGFFGYRDSGSEVWSDLMDQYGNPKQTDFSGWLFGHFAGKMDESVGTAGVMTKNGTITLADPGVCPHIGLPTTGTAVAADVVSGKIAWVDGTEIVGTALALPLNSHRGYRLFYAFPTGQAGAYNPSSADCLILASGVTLSEPDASSLDANGYLYGSTAYGEYLRISGLPARGSGPRIFSTVGLLGSGLASAAGISFLINYTDASNYWYVPFGWDGGSSFRLSIREVNAGVNTERAFATFSTVGVPALVSLEVWDAGDLIMASAASWETDTNSDCIAAQAAYYTASRFNKTVTTCGLRHNENPGSLAKFLNVTVRDVP